MFLDLKSSTTIAEKLGEEKYHEFLQHVFSDVTDPLIMAKAEIYQYVGDEVIISWNMEKIKDRPDCLNVFFEIERSLKRTKKNTWQNITPFQGSKQGPISAMPLPERSASSKETLPIRVTCSIPLQEYKACAMNLILFF